MIDFNTYLILVFFSLLMCVFLATTKRVFEKLGILNEYCQDSKESIFEIEDNLMRLDARLRIDEIVMEHDIPFLKQEIGDLKKKIEDLEKGINEVD